MISNSVIFQLKNEVKKLNDTDNEEKKKRLQKADEYYNKGLAYGQEGDPDGAIECWEKTVELNPEHFDGWYNLNSEYI